MNELLLKATLKVLTDGQAILYAMIHNKRNELNEEQLERLVNDYKEQTALLIMEVMNEAQNNNS